MSEINDQIDLVVRQTISVEQTRIIMIINSFHSIGQSLEKCSLLHSIVREIKK